MRPCEFDFPDSGPESLNWRGIIPRFAILAVCTAGLAVAVAADAADDDAAIPAAAASEDDAPAERLRAEGDDGDAAAEPAPEAAVEVAATVAIVPESAESRQVCRNIRVTGTRLPQRECRTVADWEAQAAADEEVARRMLDRRMERSTQRDLEEEARMRMQPPAGPLGF
jgi:hypothetical protein